MRRGDRVIVRRYGTPGRPAKGAQPQILDGTVVKANGNQVVVEADGKRFNAYLRQIVSRGPAAHD